MITDKRIITFEADGESNGIFSDTIELSIDTGGAHYLDYTFTANDTDVTLRFITHNNNATAHIYGISNEIAEPGTKAYGPNPKDGVLYEDTWVSFSWKPGAYAVSYDVYLGNSFEDVKDDTNDTFQGNQTVDALYFVVGFVGYPYPDGLVPGTTYYWRIDEVNDADPSSPWKWDVWSFTTPGAVGSPVPANGATDVKMTATLSWTPADSAASHEVYFGKDKDAVRNADKNSPEYKGAKALGDTGQNQISYTCRDGLGFGTPETPPYSVGNGTRSAAGDKTSPSYTEETIVHGGKQSMPVAYDNNERDYAYYSEVEKKLSDKRDWTEESVAELSLWFYGDAANAADPLYVAIANTTGSPVVVVHDNPDAAAIDTWTEWIILLQVFADQGIVLTNVDRLTIGLGTRSHMTVPGGEGKMYFDDIRLYRSREAAE